MLNEYQLLEARSWIKDCKWDNLDPQEVDSLEDSEIQSLIEKHVDGGIQEFIYCLEDYNNSITDDLTDDDELKAVYGVYYEFAKNTEWIPDCVPENAD